MANGLGIDFGASCSRVAVDDASGARLVLERPAEYRWVEITRDHRADRQSNRPDLAGCDGCLRVRTLKSLLGTGRKLPGRRAQPTESVDGAAEWHIRGLKTALEQGLGVRAIAAVFAVPAAYGMNQRAALRSIGRAAGFEAAAPLDEPLAAARHVLATGGLASRVIVYCLGRSVFSVSAVSVEGDGLTALAHEGSLQLAADAFDAEIMRVAIEDLRYHDRVSVCSDRLALAQLLERAEAARVMLTTEEEAPLEVGPVPDAAGQPFSKVLPLTRSGLEQCLAPLVARMLELTDQALAAAQWEVGSVEQVLAVGRAAETPLVRRRLAEHFGREPALLGPEAIALGAARQASSLHECFAVAPVAETAAEVAPAPSTVAPSVEPVPPPVEEDRVLAALTEARQRLSRRETEAGIAAFERLLEEARTELAYLYSMRASELERDHLLAEALARLECGLAHDPGNDHVRQRLAWVHAKVAWNLLHAGRLPECREHLKESQRLDPQNAAARQVAGALSAADPQPPRKSKRQKR